ncbi:helix-turn-helix domain-containing protein [Actinomadura macra]|uniref:helix-turn-helix domain-containing protein n=1 Tax=Actinomadura macra TaxID=46164 RepID=UPI00083691DE|nr:helix-turn-helix transcriptional regulator [Actinomadura macra]
MGERERLAAELRRLRDQAGLSGRRLAEGIGDISQSKVSRIEAGGAMPTLPQVERWADVTGVSPGQRRSLLRLAERAFTEIHAYRASPGDPSSHRQEEVRTREAGARRVRTFQPAVVPGLLQTAQYARQVFALSPLPGAAEGLPSAVAGRMDRQLALYEQDRGFEFLIAEAALRWRPGPDADRLLPAQLDRVASLSTLDNVSIGIVPDGAEALAFVSHAFVIYEGQDVDDTVVTIEAVHAAITVHDPDSIAVYERTWSALTRMAVFGDEARGLLTGLATRVRIPVE